MVFSSRKGKPGGLDVFDSSYSHSISKQLPFESLGSDHVEDMNLRLNERHEFETHRSRIEEWYSLLR